MQRCIEVQRLCILCFHKVSSDHVLVNVHDNLEIIHLWSFYCKPNVFFAKLDTVFIVELNQTLVMVKCLP